MPTGQEMREAQAFLKEAGYSVQLIFQPAARAVWYRADGTRVPGELPVDPYHMRSFQRKGWTLRPPVLPVAQPVGVVLNKLSPEAPGGATRTKLTKEERATISSANLVKARAARAAGKLRVQEVSHV